MTRRRKYPAMFPEYCEICKCPIEWGEDVVRDENVHGWDHRECAEIEKMERAKAEQARVT